MHENFVHLLLSYGNKQKICGTFSALKTGLLLQQFNCL